MLDMATKMLTIGLYTIEARRTPTRKPKISLTKRRKTPMPEVKKPAQTTEPKKWSEMTPEEKEATEKRLREKLRKYYANRPSREHIQNSMENQDE